MDRGFIQTMVRDSHDLERRNEPGQAFDKLARGVESLIDDPGHGHRRKILALFRQVLINDEAWCAARDSARKIQHFAEELGYYVGRGGASAADELGRHATSLTEAATAGDRERGSAALAELFLTLRNKRFHGHPEFSGRNIRVAHAAPALLHVIRVLLQGCSAGD